MLGSKRFSLFGNKTDDAPDGLRSELKPTLKLQTDRDVYRPGDSVSVTIEIYNPSDGATEGLNLLIERLGFEIKGIEKLDTQWFATQKPVPGSRQRRGEYVFMDCSTSSMVSNQILSSGATKTYLVRAVLPVIIPPSYRGATIRYLYYIRSTFSGRWLTLDSRDSHGPSINLVGLEARIPLQVWVTQKSNGLLMEEGQTDGILPVTTIQLDLYWKETDGDSEWTRANDLDDGVDEGYDSSRDEILSVSSYNASKENLYKNFGSSLSQQSFAVRSSSKNASNIEGGRASLSSNLTLPRLSVAEISHDSTAGTLSPGNSIAVVSPSQRQKSWDDNAAVSSAPAARTSEPAESEGFIRGRSYNIRMDDQVLLRFSPKNSESTYYFSDMIGGTLTFFHEEGTRRCLEVSITLETSETVDRQFVHPSRRNSPTITKVQSDHHEIVADLVQTSFLFSIPTDGPMSFSTAHVSVKWALRFEFFTTPKNVDWTRYEHPLLIEGRDKSEWILPITVHAPPQGTPAGHNQNDKAFSLEPLWVRT
ncbi:hypothetical protein K2173_011559 [Erythroxylum novogranatense]|uniref:Reduced growth phenotype protein 1 n=1 Tax=Erythroxylum novogranatense TaxID=1862640 RepID=A0AAV8S553_9ROSI|nr:hypothetical protein K2173_011559 [Erythroxylum novogranatense]